jgi:hypothetical protein
MGSSIGAISVIGWLPAALNSSAEGGCTSTGAGGNVDSGETTSVTGAGSTGSVDSTNTDSAVVA